jgi:hypothetical protein
MAPIRKKFAKHFLAIVAAEQRVRSVGHSICSVKTEMSRAPSTFRHVTRTVKALVAAGVDIARIEIDNAGKVSFVIGKPMTEPATNGATDADREHWQREIEKLTNK